jgi:hypothetical protein
MAKGQDMNEQQTDLDQADEEILNYTVSDEALEAAAGTEGRGCDSRFPWPAPTMNRACC